MPPFLHDDILGAGPTAFRAACTRMVLCSAEPTTFTEANATYKLADVDVDTGDMTVADGDSSGKKLSMSAQNDVPVDTPGDATHTAYLDVANSKLLQQKALPSTQAIAGTVTINAHTVHTFPDPVS